MRLLAGSPKWCNSAGAQTQSATGGAAGKLGRSAAASSAKQQQQLPNSKTPAIPDTSTQKAKTGGGAEAVAATKKPKKEMTETSPASMSGEHAGVIVICHFAHNPFFNVPDLMTLHLLYTLEGETWPWRHSMLTHQELHSSCPDRGTARVLQK